jgi:hypothetical protein
MYDIATISSRIGVCKRRIQYVIDQNIIRNLGATGGESCRGRPREFTSFDSWVLSLATLMFDAGIARDRVGELIDEMGGVEHSRKKGSLWKTWRKGTALTTKFKVNDAVTIEIDTYVIMQKFGGR